MPQTGARPMPRRIKAYSGKDVEPKNLHKLYRITLNEQACQQRSIDEVVSQLQALDEVEYAEPNYLVYAMSTNDRGDAATYMAEPLYSQQWGYAAINLPYLWNQPKVRTRRPVIAILDTGVDIEHPDLAANIWTNEKEANGADGEDDDNNGLVDDIHGYDFVNQTGKMADYNGHGTHCAGIAAAVGDNGIGITGANPDALIMPVVVMQSDGTGDIATIIKGIDYATANGADVISVSLGTYSYSLALEQSLGKAYAKAVIVAAAGNDALLIYPPFGRPMYPAAFQFVFGVMASDTSGDWTRFTNTDNDGPIYSTYSEEQLYNYELTAPGKNILSTFPKGRYKVMNGTSMACPLVAGAISRLLQCKEYASKELLLGDIVHTAQNGVQAFPGNMNIMAAYSLKESDRKPTLSFVTYHLTDTLGDNDGRADAGDTLAIYPVLRNNWGTAKNIQMWLEMGDDLEDASLITFLDKDYVDFGKPLSSYAKSRSLNPIRFAVSKRCVDGRYIKLMLKASCDGMDGILEQPVTLIVENGVEIGGMITQNLTLYPNVHYIVTTSLAIPEGVTLTIKPGTSLKFKDNTGVSIAQGGHILAHGNPDSLIVFTKADRDQGNFLGLSAYGDTLKYCSFENMNYLGWLGTLLSGGNVGSDLSENFHLILKHCKIHHNINFEVTNSELFYSTVYGNSFSHGNFSLMNFSTGYANLVCPTWVEYSNITGNNAYVHNSDHFNSRMGICIDYIKAKDVYKNNNVYGNVIYGNDPSDNYAPYQQECNFVSTSSTPMVVDAPQHWGSNQETIIKQGFGDISNNYYYCYYDLSKRLSRPSSLAHGIVWKVVVNGYDAQDEFEQLPPLGVGRHKFEVYFNRAMDTIYTPMLTMGVRSPYTQISIAENGSWSADSTIYTAYLNLMGSMATDGLCRIYVADAKDNEHFDIPIENTRFNVQVSAAGSMSTGFMAEAGLGKVNLEWNNQDANIADVLGYNMYRYTMDTLGNCLDTLRLNTELIDDTLYTDFSVTPGNTYYYYYKVLRTDLQENSPSRTVASTPLTASKGDANGSMTVDVADVVTEIAYLTNDNPQPFIFEAADVNGDSIINILDVVGTINIIVHPEMSSLGFSDDNTAVYTIEDGILYVETPVVLGGVQFTLAADRENASISPMKALQGFEQVARGLMTIPTRSSPTL